MAQLSDFLRSGGQKIGDVQYTTRSTVADGYLRADGAIYLQSAYPDLFSVLGLDLYSPPVLSSLAGSVFPSSQSGFNVASDDGDYLLTGSPGAPGFVAHKVAADGSFTKLPDPASTPGNSNVRSIATDSTATYTVVTMNYSPYVYFYKRTGDTFAKMANPSILPTGYTIGAAMSPDGMYAVVGMNDAPKIRIYKRSGSSFEKIADPASIPANNVDCAAFSADGQYLAVGMQSAPYLEIYQRSGDTFTKLASPAVLPTAAVGAVVFRGDKLFAGSNGTQKGFIYNVSAGAVTHEQFLPTGAEGIVNAVRDAAFHESGDFLAVSFSNAPHLVFFKKDALGTFKAVANPVTNLSSVASGLCFIPTKKRMILNSNYSPTLYKDAEYDSDAEFKAPVIPPEGAVYAQIKSEDV